MYIDSIHTYMHNEDIHINTVHFSVSLMYSNVVSLSVTTLGRTRQVTSVVATRSPRPYLAPRQHQT